jgi:gluconate kinase
VAPSIIVIGPQGCGKTLNGQALAKAYGLPRWCDADQVHNVDQLRTDHLLLATEVPPWAAALQVVQFADAIRRVKHPHPSTPGLGRGGRP